MKKMLVKFAMTGFYFFLLLLLTELQVQVLFDIKSILLVGMGSILLSIPCYEKKEGLKSLTGSLGKNALIASYIVTFILLFTDLYHENASEHLTMMIALNCRPLLYGFVAYVCLRKEDFIPQKTSDSKENSILSAEEIYQKFKKTGLTDREVEIAMLVKAGLTNAEIAEELWIAESTVKKHVSHIFEKLEISNRQQLRNFFL